MKRIVDTRVFLTRFLYLFCCAYIWILWYLIEESKTREVIIQRTIVRRVILRRFWCRNRSRNETPPVCLPKDTYLKEQISETMAAKQMDGIYSRSGVHALRRIKDWFIGKYITVFNFWKSINCSFKMFIFVACLTKVILPYV